MKIRVKLFAVARELAARDEITLDMLPGAKVSDLKDAIVTVCPALERIVPHAMWAIDAQYATGTTPLTEQSEVALIPPVSGG
jgi:molybdopterin converting factor small subunit